MKLTTMKRVTFRCSPGLGQMVEEKAAAAGLSTNAFICRELWKQVIRDEEVKNGYQLSRRVRRRYRER